jgi:heme oxygenase
MNNTTIEATTFPERLKEITSQSHKNLESLPVSVSIVSPSVTKEEYTHYLSLMHDVVKDAEENIFPQLEGVINGVSERNKTHLLENDLAALGYPKKDFKKPLSVVKDKFSDAFALGVMYVIEGSTLGGRFILKNINEALGYSAEDGAQYFAGYGNATGSHWKSFMNQMTQYEESSKNDTEIIAGANFAFDAINKHFTENTPK